LTRRAEEKPLSLVLLVASMEKKKEQQDVTETLRDPPPTGSKNIGVASGSTRDGLGEKPTPLVLRGDWFSGK
jgi:hypothetical protein